MSYLLGVSPYEVRRLEFQEKVWGGMTRGLLDRLGARSPWRCLDVGAGIGCVTLPLARRVAPRGSVTALEPSPGYAREIEARVRRQGIRNVAVVPVGLQDLAWTGEPFDFILCRWVFLFIKDVDSAVAKLTSLLKPGGVLAVEDYHNYIGMSLYPRSPAFQAVIRAAGKWFLRHGGGLQVAGELPAVFARRGLDLLEFRPNVQAGDGRSDVFRWAGLFFLKFVPGIAEAGGLTAKQVRAFRKDWARRRGRRDSVLVSPIIFDVVGRRRPGPAVWPLGLREASSGADIVGARTLLGEYKRAAGHPLCFEGFEDEVVSLPGRYAPPSGRLILASWKGSLAGCVGLRQLGLRTGEMKRLYVRKAFRRRGIGRALALAAIQSSRGLGYRAVRLDTLPSMRAAESLYKDLGFKLLALPKPHPVAGIKFFELDLNT